MSKLIIKNNGLLISTHYMYVCGGGNDLLVGISQIIIFGNVAFKYLPFYECHLKILTGRK